MKYAEVLKKLYQFNVKHPVSLKLDNMRHLNDLFQNPMKEIPIIHVAGTNGKGSVSVKVANTMQQIPNSNIGLYTSPHISTFRERIQVNNHNITEEEVQELLPEIFLLCEKHGIPATFFELITILAFRKFELAKCSTCIIEVGVGGLLDATNIVTPVLSVITSIQMDHMKLLGETLEQIAIQKCGIMKKGVPVLVGPQCPMHIMKSEAARIGADLKTLSDVLSIDERRVKDLSTCADIDDLNYDLAHAAIRLLAGSTTTMNLTMVTTPSDLSKLHASLLSRPPCRFETFQCRTSSTLSDGTRQSFQCEIILDIAHNEEALKALSAKLDTYLSRHAKPPPIHVVASMSADKDLSKCLPWILKMVRDQPHRIVCSEVKHARAMSHQDFRRMIQSLHPPLNPSPSERSHWLDTESVHLAIRRSILTSHLTLAGMDPSDLRTETEEDYWRLCTTIGFQCHHLGRKKDQRVIDHLMDQSMDQEVVDGMVLVCGTAFMMSEARHELGVVEARDSHEIEDEAMKDGQVLIHSIPSFIDDVY